MTPLILLVLLQTASAVAPAPAAAPPPPSAVARRFGACAALAATDPAKAAADADAWRVAGGGLPARECLGIAYAAQERWGPASIAFEQAATEAEIQRDGRAANLWVQAGNAALAGEDPAKARTAFDRALRLPVLSEQMRGEAFLDRARAAVELNDLGGARADIDQALKLVPADPLAWLLSATLARRQQDKARAAADIAQAAKLAPDDPAVLFESGNVAALAGAAAAARSAWTRAAAKDPDGPAGGAAAAALAERPAAEGKGPNAPAPGGR